MTHITYIYIYIHRNAVCSLQGFNPQGLELHGTPVYDVTAASKPKNMQQLCSAVQSNLYLTELPAFLRTS